MNLRHTTQATIARESVRVERTFKATPHTLRHFQRRGSLIVRFSLCIFNELPIRSVALMNSFVRELNALLVMTSRRRGISRLSVHNYHHVLGFD